ncbi:MAG: HAMP domain-containing sensor histidine kinase [Acidimicrobiales bacterium]
MGWATSLCPEPRAEPRVASLWTRFGLRARVTVMFALGALVLSVTMGAISYFTTRHILVSDNENSAISTAFTHAKSVQTEIRDGEKPVTILSSADYGTTGSSSLLYRRGQWYERHAAVTPSFLPRGLTQLVGDGTSASVTYATTATKKHPDRPRMAVGIALPTAHGSYYEIFDLDTLSHTLRVLLLALFGAGMLTTVLGAALGRWASGRSLRPLAGVSRAAVAIAGGDLDTRLAAGKGDPVLGALATSFNTMVDQLQERIEHETRFTSDVSHELRSPLTTIAASLAVLEAQSADLTPPSRRALELLSGDLRRFQRLVEDLLEISRSDAGAADLSFEEVDPAELARQAVSAAQRTLALDTPAPRVEVDPDVAGMRLLVDKRRFERVVANLLENASHYGGGATVVRVEPGQQSNGSPHVVRVSVEDAGPGLPPTERQRVFERFYRGHAAYRRGAGTGTGLGLALVAEHVRVHGGKVWADEAAGGGARFTIELPGGEAQTEAAQTEAAAGDEVRAT